MSGGWKDVVKSGWHPEKNGTSIRNQVKGLVGRGDSSPSEREAHEVTPTSSLRDPASFGPPPKRVATYGSTRPPAGGTASSSSLVSPSTSTYTPSQSSSYAAETPGVNPSYQAQDTEEEQPPTEPQPYRVDTTGLSTTHLPPPPTRNRGADGQRPQLPPPPPARSPAPTVVPRAAVTAAKPGPPPSLPPRLPPRSDNGTPSPILGGEQAVNQAFLNQGAVNRLGAAGITVPGLGIGGGGGRTPPPLPPPGTRSSPSPSPKPTPMPTTHGGSHVDELQARFARMGASSSQVASGTTQQQPIGQASSVLGKKKPPPPVPKKSGRPETRVEDAPPPIPLATRPKFD